MAIGGSFLDISRGMNGEDEDNVYTQERQARHNNFGNNNTDLFYSLCIIICYIILSITIFFANRLTLRTYIELALGRFVPKFFSYSAAAFN